MTRKDYVLLAEMLGAIINNVQNRLRDSDIDEIITTAFDFLGTTNPRFDPQKFEDAVRDNI